MRLMETQLQEQSELPTSLLGCRLTDVLRNLISHFV